MVYLFTAHHLQRLYQHLHLRRRGAKRSYFATLRVSAISAAVFSHHLVNQTHLDTFAAAQIVAEMRGACD